MCSIVPNAAFRPKTERRLYVADQIDEFVDFASIMYRRPFDKGYCVNAELERQIWDRIFGKHVLDLKTRDCSLIVSEPPLNFPSLQRQMDEIVFEKFQFASFCRASGTLVIRTGRVYWAGSCVGSGWSPRINGLHSWRDIF